MVIPGGQGGRGFSYDGLGLVVARSNWQPCEWRDCPICGFTARTSWTWIPSPLLRPPDRCYDRQDRCYDRKPVAAAVNPLARLPRPLLDRKAVLRDRQGVAATAKAVAATAKAVACDAKRCCDARPLPWIRKPLRCSRDCQIGCQGRWRAEVPQQPPEERPESRQFQQIPAQSTAFRWLQPIFHGCFISTGFQPGVCGRKELGAASAAFPRYGSR